MTSRSPQRGVAAVVFLAILAVILIAVLTTALSSRSAQTYFDARTIPVLAAAKEALLAYAAANPTAPGRLPCVDANGDGVANNLDLPCTTANVPQLGRLPWKTLGIPILRDGSGECLWYAVSGNFAQTSTLTHPINSNVPGQFTVKQDPSSSTPLATGVIAVIFAPGPVLEGNDRSPPAGPATPCGGNNDPRQYLDPIGTSTNADLGVNMKTFFEGTPSDTFNDRLIYITPADLFPRVERRVGQIIAANLQAYFTANGYFPNASTFASPDDCAPGLYRGLLPVDMTGCGLAPWPSSGPGAMPTWLTDDKWNQVTYYAVAVPCTTPVDTVNCNGGTGLLTLLNGKPPINTKKALIIEAGVRLAGQTRPAESATDLLDAWENTNGDNTYISLPRSGSNNDIVIEVGP